MTSDDIVARLRELTTTLLLGDFRALAATTDAAADEIERLRSVVEAWLKYSQRAERDIETLRAERDEARREVCSMNETGLRMNESDKRREAKRRGWQCFKENTDDR